MSVVTTVGVHGAHATYIEIEQISPLLAGEASAEVRLIPGLSP